MPRSMFKLKSVVESAVDSFILKFFGTPPRSCFSYRDVHLETVQDNNDTQASRKMIELTKGVTYSSQRHTERKLMAM
ncbi:hypothetical protein MKW98_018131 [Papaver atlanticum]|uniref:Uncharacterized protein n=1 Tax=Papaver atlanticum TaxID=357466 RepID=A0AAD4XAX3_9MAGN|nr:hypothetical protein MKW98_018131 [Papaver atlanticum]